MPEQLTPEVVDQAPDVTPADVTDQDALLTELASLSPLDYDRRRADAAKLLGVRVGSLDAAVEARRAKVEEQTVAAQAAAATPAPWTNPVDGATLLADLASLYARYVVLPKGAANMLALWTVHTYAIDAFMITPRLAVVSPQKRCGKTTLMALTGAVAARTLYASHITRSALFRAIAEWRPSIFIDEADTFLKDNEELRGVLNAGHYKPTAYVVCSVPQGESWAAETFSVWGAVAIALIGSLPSTLADRSITVRLRRKTQHEQVERLRLDRLGDVAEALKRRCLRWVQDHLEQIRESDPAVPETLNDRAADNWRPLCAIAEIAGGEWPQRVREAIKALATEDSDAEAAGILLLQDIQDIFDQHGAEEGESKEEEPKMKVLSSKQIVQYLHAIEERPWSEWSKARKPITERQLADVLRPFEIRSRTVRLPDNSTPKGYRLDQFKDAWERYIPVPPSFSDAVSATPPQPHNDAENMTSRSATHAEYRSATPPQPRHDAGHSTFDPQQPSNGNPVADRNARTPAPMAACGSVANQIANQVADRNVRTPAPMAACGGVAEETPGGEGVKVGAWVLPLSAEGVIIPDGESPPPYLVSTIEQGPDGQLYAQFVETGKYWPLAQCKRTDPPAPAPPPDDMEEF